MTIAFKACPRCIVGDVENTGDGEPFCLQCGHRTHWTANVHSSTVSSLHERGPTKRRVGDALNPRAVGPRPAAQRLHISLKVMVRTKPVRYRDVGVEYILARNGVGSHRLFAWPVTIVGLGWVIPPRHSRSQLYRRIATAFRETTGHSLKHVRDAIRESAS